VTPEVTGPRKLVITQKWTVPKGVNIRKSGVTTVLPLGRTYYIRPHSWKTIHLPWKLDLKDCPCTVCSALSMPNMLSSVTVDKSGAVKIQVYNCSTEVTCLPARTLGVRIFGAATFEWKKLPNEGQGDIRTLHRGIQGSSEPEVRKSLMQHFPRVFDLSEHVITPAMKALKIKPEELPNYGQVTSGGQQCTFRIDRQVRDRDIEEVLQRYEELGYISRARLNEAIYLSPLMPFRKPGKTDIRVVNDFRELNGYFPTHGRTQIDVRRVIDKVPCQWKFFTVIDLKDGFFSIPLDPALRRLFGFQFGHRRWVYNRLPQGFSFSPIFFAERVAHILEGTNSTNFADDVIVGGATPEEHHSNLFAVFRRLEKYGLKVNSEKMKLFRRELSFLRYSLRDGQWTLSDYLADKWRQLGEIRSRRELERHIGILSFARTHIPDIELLLRPLRRLLLRVKTTRICLPEWQVITDRVRDVYRSCLEGHRALSLSNDAFSRFLLFTDWTDFHTGYMLFGVSATTGAKKLLDIGSHTLPVTTSSYLGELNGIIIALKKTRRLRGNSSTEVYSDNCGVIEKLRRGAAISDDVRVCRRLEYILHNEPNTQFRFLPGTENTGADALSRLKQKTKASEDIRIVQQNHRPIATEIQRRLRHAHFGHWSAETTYRNAIMEFGRWTGIRKDVEEYCKRCTNCSFSGNRQIRDNYSLDTVSAVNQRVHIDYTGPFFDGSHILVIVDEFSRFIQAEHTMHVGAAFGARQLDRWINRFGLMETLCADNASYWACSWFKNWAEERQIKLRLNPSYYHPGNSTVERSIQTLQNRMRRFLNGSSEQWPEVIPASVQAMNQSWHSTIQTCPQALAIGRDRNNNLIPETEMTRIVQRAMHSQEEQKIRENERFDWKHPRKSHSLAIGDRVLLKDPRHLSKPLKKLAPRWTGPYVLRDRNSRSTWLISKETSQSTPFLTHSSQLRQFHP